MILSNRFCTLVGHNKVHVTHQCIFEDCKLLQRQCCIKCINEGIHNHDKSDRQYIRLEQEIQKVQQKLLLVENEINVKPIDFSKRKYNLKEIDNGGLQTTAHISNNEKYLAYGGDDKILKIYDLKQGMIIKELKTNSQIYVCQFTSDSSQLFVGCYYYIDYDDQYFSVVLSFDVQKNFKKIFEYNIKSWPIYNLITVQIKYLITFVEKMIIKTDIKRNKSIKFNCPQFQAMDYNQYYDFIIGGCKYGDIKLWDCCNRSFIINKKQAHSHYVTINQIQFINNIQNVLSLDNYYNLHKWRIDLIHNALILIQQYEDPYGIFSFCSINQNQNLLLVCGLSVKIIDDKKQIINQLDHQCGHNLSITKRQRRQLDQARYIHVVGDDKIMLATAIE